MPPSGDLPGHGEDDVRPQSSGGGLNVTHPEPAARSNRASYDGNDAGHSTHDAAKTWSLMDFRPETVPN